jgi:4-diphosphocytidyl-2-C-methyl-D-erythritol kinase
MQAISLTDEISLQPAEQFAVTVDPLGAAPADGTNLALRAARSLATLHNVEIPVRIDIRKQIPVGAGMAGGSADAAAVLTGLNELWETRISKKALEKIGASLGSDVPFCIRGGTAAVRGTGEDISSLPCPSPIWWVLGISEKSLSTSEVYAELDRQRADSSSVAALGDPYEVADALARGDVERLAGALHNDLQPAALALMPQIASGEHALLEADPHGADSHATKPTPSRSPPRPPRHLPESKSSTQSTEALR